MYRKFFIVQIFSYGYGSHDYYFGYSADGVEDPADAIEMAKSQANEQFPFANYHELSAIYQSLNVNARGELVS
jgi:hypothetical protein